MFRIIVSIFVCSFFFGLNSSFAQETENENEKNKEVLVFYKTAGFWHEAIPTGRDFISDLGEDHIFEVSTTQDADDFNDENLAEFDLVIFLNTTGNVLDDEEQEAFEKYIENGGNFFGIHAAADTEYEWPWYGELVGGYFDGHPEVQQADVILNMPEHPAVAHLPEVWSKTDEWYNYKNLNPEMQVLLYLDEDSYEGGTNGEEHPIAWFRETGHGGVSIYTGLGHTIESYIEPLFQEHILQSILFALGEEK
ncbi:ThuA domain-containing protein [Salegentibacter sp. JZCK2]|uniref:ThuA domain-containing protein n=1 Tax=Salegentibacter tibetensis TaxID=2873600 RepID=UPI001CCF7FDF|nr:ThuA domain-containing protein [Salegentibacter tibetensis]MBZ9730422.1 ThuA domain-containing protein [Salegentibacter tibetensis]